MQLVLYGLSLLMHYLIVFIRRWSFQHKQFALHAIMQLPVLWQHTIGISLLRVLLYRRNASYINNIHIDDKFFKLRTHRPVVSATRCNWIKPRMFVPHKGWSSILSTCSNPWLIVTWFSLRFSRCLYMMLPWCDMSVKCCNVTNWTSRASSAHCINILH